MVEGEEVEKREDILISGSKRNPVTHIRAKASSLKIRQNGFNLEKITTYVNKEKRINNTQSSQE